MVRLLSSLLILLGTVSSRADETKIIPSGSYRSFLKSKTGVAPVIRVESFTMDRYPVTKGQFLNFVTKNPSWRKSKVKSVFADAHYLENWSSDLAIGSQNAKGPVNFVSWFAASAYCNFAGKTLPSTDQWEYAAEDLARGKSKATESILEWYSQPNTKRLRSVGESRANGFGIFDLFGLVWEWTEDFGDNGAKEDGKLFCGGAGQAAADPSDYATFMRFSFRGSLEAKYALANLGFRCVERK